MRKTKKIIIFKDDLKSYKELNISYRIIFFALSGVGISLSVILFLIANFIFSTTHDYKMRKLKSANDVLWEQVAEIRSQLNNYNSMIENIVQKDEQLRLALNLPPLLRTTTD